ncbi:hypothetical protein IB262_34380 [Ensifer sp. ENS02]|uniref:hypothetical protein n=1 Tax=Ensifer TaxID=106591 RepID=UPI000DE42DA1|nr:hypothetical protein [Ensifer sp. ENS02]MBD9524946.1 hypothetical protein [Ensifer sp. ENS02]
MTPNEIPDFVNELIAAGCEITAIGREMYVIGEAKGASAEVRRITKKYGERDPLRLEIIADLRSFGRYIEQETEETGH